MKKMNYRNKSMDLENNKGWMLKKVNNSAIIRCRK